MDRPVEVNGGIIGDSNTSISAASIEHTTEGADDNRDSIRPRSTPGMSCANTIRPATTCGGHPSVY